MQFASKADLEEGYPEPAAPLLPVPSTTDASRIRWLHGWAHSEIQDTYNVIVSIQLCISQSNENTYLFQTFNNIHLGLSLLACECQLCSPILFYHHHPLSLDLWLQHNLFLKVCCSSVDCCCLSSESHIPPSVSLQKEQR